MTSADHYRAKAAEFAAMAQSESDPWKQAYFAQMSASYQRLAKMAEKNSETDVVFEPPSLSLPT